MTQTTARIWAGYHTIINVIGGIIYAGAGLVEIVRWIGVWSMPPWPSWVLFGVFWGASSQAFAMANTADKKWQALRECHQTTAVTAAKNL